MSADELNGGQFHRYHAYAQLHMQFKAILKPAPEFGRQ